MFAHRGNCYLLLALAAGGVAWSLVASAVFAEETAIEPGMIHLRSGVEREWTYFPEEAPDHWSQELSLPANDRPLTLEMRQQDVKQSWRVLLNGKPLGELLLDERDARRWFRIEAGALTGKRDVLRIEPKGKHALSDDIYVGQITVREGDPEAYAWREAEIEVTDSRSGEPLPCCLTIVDRHGSLVPLGMKSNDHLAVRTGVVYTSTGKAILKLPREDLTLYATRGFEYSLAKGALRADDAPAAYRLTLTREVPVPGYVACDTHLHTLTHSGHGDATIEERMITIAGEGIELPVAADHNVLVDYTPHAERLNVRKYFTPVMGCEVTTKVGHWNVFPVKPGSAPPRADLADWESIFAEIYKTPGVRVAILNHARDLHSGVRPFGPKLFNAAVAEQLEGWPLRFNGMEILNSGATQSQPLELTHDWMALLNRGYQVTPVGSSDSHDVSRFIAGQGRTYIRTPDDDPAAIDIDHAVDSFLAGRVLVSYGLLAEIKIDNRYSSGDLATGLEREIEVAITVSAPHWINPSQVQLYANGQLLREVEIPLAEVEGLSGVKWHDTWRLPRPEHDVYLVAVALGPGIEAPYWPTARPYQPTSPELVMHTLGCSGAVWIDGDGDRRRTSAREYAEKLWTAVDKNPARFIERLAKYDAAVAAQGAFLYHRDGGRMEWSELKKLLAEAHPSVDRGFGDYYAAWRKSELARAAP
jgi:hypothetical protein